MPRHARRLKIRRKDLRKPDEFETLTGQAVAWAGEHRPVVYGVLAVAVVVLAGSLAIGRWRASRNDAAAVAFRSAQARFDEGKFQEAAQDFAYVVERCMVLPPVRRADTKLVGLDQQAPRRAWSFVRTDRVPRSGKIGARAAHGTGTMCRARHAPRSCSQRPATRRKR